MNSTVFSVKDAATTMEITEAGVTSTKINPNSTLTWDIDLVPGRYAAEIEMACMRYSDGSRYQITIQDKIIRGVTPRTESFDHFLRVRLGEFDITEKTTAEFRIISCKDKIAHFKALHLIPVEDANTVSVSSSELGDADFGEFKHGMALWKKGFLAGPGNNVNVIINPESTYQTIEGIGGTFNEKGGEVLLSLGQDKRDEVLAKIFGKDAGFSFCCLPVGASDFALTPYSLDETDGDYEMKDFTTAQDEKYLIPYIKEAQKHNPDLKFHARPWSPPAWMKTTKDMNYGSLTATPEVYQAHALYLCKFVEAMAEHGIEIKRLVAQNEPDVAGGYTGCIYSASQYAEFFAKYLRPTADKLGLDAELWAGSFQGIWKATASRVMDEPGMVEAADGVAFQYNDYGTPRDFRYKHPEMPVMHTESPCHGGENTDTQALGLYFDIVEYLNLGATAYTYWNMILDSHQESYVGWKQNSMLKIDGLTGEVTYNPEFGVMTLFGNAIQAGAKRVETFCMDNNVVSVKNPDGSVVSFVDNPADKETTFFVYCNGTIYPTKVPAKSIASITIS